MIKVETRRRMKEDRKDRGRISGNKETKQGSMNERRTGGKERYEWNKLVTAILTIIVICFC